MSGILTDKNDREIMVGDTLKIYHFTGARRKRHYMYKYVESLEGNKLKIRHLNPKNKHYFEVLPQRIKKLEDVEIVQGYGSDGESFECRPKKKESV